jgi:hypothetical protein
LSSKKRSRRGDSKRIRKIAVLTHDVRNPATAEYLFPVIKHGCLAWRYSPLGLVEFGDSFDDLALDLGSLAVLPGGAPNTSLWLDCRFHARRGAGMIMADLHVAFDDLAIPEGANPVDVAYYKLAMEKFSIGAHDYAIPGSIQFDDVKGRTHSYA